MLKLLLGIDLIIAICMIINELSIVTDFKVLCDYRGIETKNCSISSHILGVLGFLLKSFIPLYNIYYLTMQLIYHDDIVELMIETVKGDNND